MDTVAKLHHYGGAFVTRWTFGRGTVRGITVPEWGIPGSKASVFHVKTWWLGPFHITRWRVT